MYTNIAVRSLCLDKVARLSVREYRSEAQCVWILQGGSVYEYRSEAQCVWILQGGSVYEYRSEAQYVWIPQGGSVCTNTAASLSVSGYRSESQRA